MTYGFDILSSVVGENRLIVQAVGISVQVVAMNTKDISQQQPVRMSQISNSAYAQTIQLGCSGPPNHEHLRDRHRPQQPLEILTRNNRSGIRLLIVAAHLGKYLVEGDTG